MLTDDQDARPRRRRKKRRGLLAAILTLLVVGAIGTYTSLALLEPVAATAGSAEQLTVSVPDPVAFAVPYSGASALSMMGAEQFPATAGADGILVSSGGGDPRPIASITKLITALVVLDAYPIGQGEAGPTLTFSEADSDLYDQYYVLGATIQPMKEGASMTLHDALEVMLVTSATNYADAVATWAFGSHSDFVGAAETWLAANGLVNTTIVEPTGIDPGNLSTPTELVAIGKLALANPVLAEIVRSTVLDVPGLEHVSNTNTLLSTHGVTGIKTGTLEEAGSCLLFSAVIDVGLPEPITVVGAVLGGPNHDGVDHEVVALLDSVTAGFHSVTAIEAGTEVGSYASAWGDEAVVVTADSASLLTWSDLPVTANVDLKPVTSAADGATVGTATFVAGSETVSVPLVLQGAITEPDGWWKFTHPAF